MEIKYKFNDTDEIYDVKSNLEFVKRVKNSNAHTKNLSIEDYIAQQLGVMENLWKADVPEQKTADALVQVWLEHNIVSEMNKSNTAQPGNK